MPEGRQSPRRAAGALEAEVLRVLRNSDSAMSPLEVQAALDGSLAYNTVHTILTRLYEKGAVNRASDNGRIGYTPSKGAAQEAADRMRAVLAASQEHQDVLQRFVTGLSAEEEQALRRALDTDRSS
jgi:predicted transcriptional regulator